MNPSEPTPPSPEQPLAGGCLCGAVRYEVIGPFLTAGYCHCTRCQRRSGTAASANGALPREFFRLLSGEQSLRSFQPPGGSPKVFCADCGSAMFSGDLASGNPIGLRLGGLDEDPGVAMRFRQYVAFAAPWEPIPEDGLPRYPESRPAA